ncbi:MAG: RagB/SusD family nutrient uptake outer membrane protein [Chitinophagaceae bacterium]|nr:RagB/SusD family nutrient uptake outer membrane protein [Chitinophagaceae bacterium]
MKYIIFLITGSLLLSCNKFLDKPGDPTKIVPKTIADAQMLMDKPVSNGCTYIGADEYYVTNYPWNMYMGYPQNRDYYFNWITNSTTGMVGKDFWQESYNAIFHTNVAIEILNKIPVTEANRKAWEQAMGCAHFIRAWSYLSIAWQFCNAWHDERSKTDLGAVLDLESDFLNQLSRSTVAETYDQILKDAGEAVKYLPLFSENPARPCRLAAYGLMTRIYLSMRKYEDALAQCDHYLSDLNALLDFNNPAEVNLGSDYPISWSDNKELIYYNHSVYLSGTGYPLDFLSVAADTTIYKSFHENDLRKKAYFHFNGEYYEFTGSPLLFDACTGIATDEIYISRAECYARQGETGKAMKDLNDLLVTRWKSGTFIPFTANSKEEALDIILAERKKELLFRGLRWMDIKRLNEEGANISITRKSPDHTITGTLLPGSPRFAMQLPADLIASFGYKQNPIE